MTCVKAGYCAACGRAFYWTLGQLLGWGDEDTVATLWRWWLVAGNVCPACAVAEESEVSEREAVVVDRVVYQ